MPDISANQNNSWFLLTLRRLPGRLTAEQVARLGGFQTHDVPTLVKSKLIEPLGTGAKNSVKYFAAAEILEKTNDPKWLDRATRVLARPRNGAKPGVKALKPEVNQSAP